MDGPPDTPPNKGSDANGSKGSYKEAVIEVPDDTAEQLQQTLRELDGCTTPVALELAEKTRRRLAEVTGKEEST